jgi:molecular chaperone GrpE (heat shock protein)
MLSIFEIVQNIAKGSNQLRNNESEIPSSTIDYISIFTQNSEEYEFYMEEALKIGNIILEHVTGSYIELNEVINTIEGEVEYLKVRKPDSTKMQKGSVNYIVDDYLGIKERYIEQGNFQVYINTQGIEEMILLGEDYNASFPSESVIEKILKNRKPLPTENNEEFKKKLEEEAQKRIQLMSDFQNYQRRVESEKAMFGAMASMGLIQEMLEIFDDLNLAITDENLDLDNAKSSIKSAQDKLTAAVKSAGVEKVDVQVGEAFDKERMEAISAIPVDDEDKKGKVIAVISSAYKYSGKTGVLKFAKVVVGK